MLFQPMWDGEDSRTPEEQLEQLDVLRHLDARDVVSEAIHAADEAPAAEDDTSQQAQRRRLWLGLRLALIITLGVVLIVAALFRYVVPGAPKAPPEESPVVIPEASTPAPPETSVIPTTEPVVEQPPEPPAESKPTAEQIQQQISQITKWRLDLGQDSVSGAAFGPDGEIYLTGYDKQERVLSLYRVSPRGKVQWRYEFADLPSRELLVGPDGTCYMFGYKGQQYAIDSRGRLDWQLEPGGKGAAMAVSGDGKRLYLVREGGNLLKDPAAAERYSYRSVLYAIDRRGQVVWERPLPGELTALTAPTAQVSYCLGIIAAEDGTLYLSTRSDQRAPATLWAYSPDGTLRWQFELTEGDGHKFSRMALGPHGEVYAATYCGLTDHGMLYAFDRRGGLTWQARDDVHDRSCPQVGPDGTVYIVCGRTWLIEDQSQLLALDPRDGSERWHVAGRDRDRELVIGPDGLLYYPTHDGVLAITPEGMVRWLAPSYGGPAHFAPDGQLFLGNNAIGADGRTLYHLPVSGELMIDPRGRKYAVSSTGVIEALAD